MRQRPAERGDVERQDLASIVAHELDRGPHRELRLNARWYEVPSEEDAGEVSERWAQRQEILGREPPGVVCRPDLERPKSPDEGMRCERTESFGARRTVPEREVLERRELFWVERWKGSSYVIVAAKYGQVAERRRGLG
ncbi:hypothetical protein [Sorangium cellulosum]|uniref:hypothetical protein n=1 Tax=Sorangium cellulosum TaxID=56 RepID=UPI0011DE2AB3|nr:hypothetical protein [Sorangium cellulosum]